MNLPKVTRHKIEEDRRCYILFHSVEHCHMCGVKTYEYISEDGILRGIHKMDETFPVNPFSANYIRNYPNDIVYNGYIYHTCSEHCREMFSLTLGSIDE